MKNFNIFRKVTVLSVAGLFTLSSFAQELHDCGHCGGCAPEPDKNAEKIRQIEDYLLKVKNDWKIPGMAMSIVKDGKLIYAKGFGSKDLIKGDGAVDENTVFQIGSVSKSFTAAVMASLVDEGLVKWDDTVKNILPDLRLYDKWVENNLQVKDIMTHRMGLRGQMGTYIPNMGYSRDDVYKMMELMKPKYSFRGSYEYNNITFIIAEKIIEKLTGKSWEENVNERIFKRLGMSNSTLNKEGFLAAGDVAVPHEFDYRLKKGISEDLRKFASLNPAGTIKDSLTMKKRALLTDIDSVAVAPLYGEEQALHWLTVIGPAGSVCSSVTDLAKYAQFHLDNGSVDSAGKRIQVISRKNMDYIHRGLTITSQDSARTTLYGQCWFVEQNNRYRLWFHTGTTWGFTALVAFVPELKLGMAILVNSEAPSSPRYAIMRRLIDLYLPVKGELRDYNAEYISEWAQSGRESAMSSIAGKRAPEKAVKTEADPLEKRVVPEMLTGIYDKDPLFGRAIITLENGDLYITAGPQGWKHKLTRKSGLNYTFSSDGHTFPVKFIIKERKKKAEDPEKVKLSKIKIKALDIDFGYDENFGAWNRVKK